MKKFLKIHGKKVSVLLLALALMISPMLNVMAADSCPKKSKVLLFAEAENMLNVSFKHLENDCYIEGSWDEDGKYKTKEVCSENSYSGMNVDGGNALGYIVPTTGANNTATLAEYQAMKISDAIIQALWDIAAGGSITFNGCIASKNSDGTTGIDGNGVLVSSCNKKVVYDNNEDFLKDIYRPNARLSFSSQFMDIYGWKKAYYNTLIQGGYIPNNININSGNGGYWGIGIYDDVADSGKGFSLISLTDFISTIPSDASVEEVETSREWTKEDIDADVELELMNYKKADKDLVEYEASETVSYVRHGAWRNAGYNPASGDNSTVVSNRIEYIKAHEGNLENFKKDYKKALLTGMETSFDSDEDEKNGVAIWDVEVARTSMKASDSNNTELKNALTVLPENNAWHKLPWNGQIDNWIYMPAKLTYNYTEANCTVDTGSGEDNPETGVASYAIIGTLLVGAASAYMYARKNNKFNRV